jgi:hypothetical protein
MIFVTLYNSIQQISTSNTIPKLAKFYGNEKAFINVFYNCVLFNNLDLDYHNDTLKPSQY